eukprot:TRINITY_DN132_c1_g1_i1.p1 TRINITY_DN132_c1_g1~~TRINITY_DN132_c1_g1_i1.p1  ORF type:complete len:214 (+),score=72.38 TRINITY_DN132_c1_g1_i1:288-929(+)
MLSTISPKRNFERMEDESFSSMPQSHYYSPSKMNSTKKVRTQEKLIEIKHRFQQDTPFKIKEPFEIDTTLVKRLKRRREMQQKNSNNTNNSPFNINNNNISPFNNHIIENNNNNFAPFQNNIPNNNNNIIQQNKHQRIDNNNTNNENEKLLSEQLFSANDVKKIVEERENKLINEFTQVLLERLDQQYQTFSQYTEDFLSRQMKNSEFDDYIN